MAISLGGSGAAQTSGVGITGTVVAGQLITVATRNATTAPTDNKSGSNVYTEIGAHVDAGGSTLSLFYCIPVVGGSSFVITSGGSASDRITAAWWSGFLGTPTLDQHRSDQSGSSTQPRSGATGTRTQANELLWTALQSSSGAAPYSIPGGGIFTLIDANAIVGAAHAYYIASAAGTDQGAINLNTAGDWSMAIATFYDAVSGGGFKSAWARGSNGLLMPRRAS